MEETITNNNIAFKLVPIDSIELVDNNPRNIDEKVMEITDMWLIKKVQSNSYVHPTQKPISLLENPLKRCTHPGQTVLDFFGGSGTTLMACEQLDRKARIVEWDPVFVDLIINRWESYTGQKANKINRYGKEET